MNLESSGMTDKGCVRDANEDRILLNPSLGLFAVCDGMGGHRRGEVAADIAIATMQYYLDASRDRFDVTWPFGYDFDLSIDANRLITAIRLANRQVWRHAEQSLECAGMGSTIAAVLVDGNSIVAGNAGDTRVYLRASDGLHGVVGDDAIRSILLSDPTPETCSRRLIETARTAGAPDNVSVVVLEYK
jgi:protein phosphatase